MKLLTFAKRCCMEILRDRLNLAFGLGFPLVLLVLLSAIQANIPVPLFEIETLTPGITVFGLSFLTLFSATLVARDRETAFLQRLYTTPMTAADFIAGYLLPMLPMALGQSAVCYFFSVALGLRLSGTVLWAVIGILPIALFHISLGLLCGSVLGVKQVGGLCGALLTNLSAWLSGVWPGHCPFTMRSGWSRPCSGENWPRRGPMRCLWCCTASWHSPRRCAASWGK